MTTSAKHDLSFTPTPRLRRLVLVAGLSIIGAAVTAQGLLLALAVVPLVVLVAAPRAQLPGTAVVIPRLGPLRCVEGDELVLELEVSVGGAAAESTTVTAELALPAQTEAVFEGSTDNPARTAGGTVTTTVRWLLVPQRWGRHRVGPVQVRVVAGAGCYAARLRLEVDEIVVYPGAAALARSVAPRELAAPLGEHPSRAAGSGVEFAGVRPYSHGDRRRDIDWRTSARHGGVFVRQYADERAFDLVLVLDTTVDAGAAGQSTLDLTVRAATGLAQTYLRSHDRVGLVTFGGPLHWLSPATGPLQLYRVCEALMSVRPDQAERDAGSVGFGLENLPRRMLPSRAFVCLVTPLLDDRPLGVVQLLRGRGFSPLVVDVLTSEPEVDRRSPAELAVRAWRMQREALTVELGTLGVPVLPWDGEGDLTGALIHAMRSVRPEART